MRASTSDELAINNTNRSTAVSTGLERPEPVAPSDCYNTAEMSESFNRRRFLQAAAATTVSAATIQRLSAYEASFDRPDSLYHGDDWETLNPGYWEIKGNALRRKIHSYGDRARRTGFPYHYETHGPGGNRSMAVDYDPSLPPGVIWHRGWRLRGEYGLQAEGRILAKAHGPANGDSPEWEMYRRGHGLVGLAFGSATLYESFGMSGPDGKAAWIAAWTDDGYFGIREHGSDQAIAIERVPEPSPGDRFLITADIANVRADRATAAVTLEINGQRAAGVQVEDIAVAKHLAGFAGIAGRGLVDFEIGTFTVVPGNNAPLEPALNECHVCYALGDTLTHADDAWGVRFVALFRGDGETAEVRVADSPTPSNGWASVPPAGSAPIVNNDFRRNTAVIDAKLPLNPADQDLYYTVWKDGRNVTADPRLGTDAVGLGTGQVGEVPSNGSYVGRLPRLTAPYKLCGLSCHAIHGGGPKLPDAGPGGGFFVHDQPTPQAYQHLEEFDFQVMMWEDDVWYMELLLYPPSPDDAYKIVTTTLCGPTTRWQMMRHWNTINPGDHDYGMDDVKGPEQIAIRTFEDLGQDRDYMRRNFQIVHHLVTGDEAPSGTANPKKWRRWKMPNRDFSLLILDSRLWRSSQDTNIWDDQGWGAKESLYSRADVTRSLLGEEQFAWLRETIRSDSSPLICLTGINGMHTIWTGNGRRENAKTVLGERDRVAADYAGWVMAGADRVLDVLGCRDGVVTVYGDVHVGMILQNLEHQVFECSFGPIGRSGGRGVKEGFGPRMQDFDGRNLEIKALYHQRYDTPDLQKLDGPFYWNFLEMEFDPRGADPTIGLRIRNLVDSPADDPRGGGSVLEKASATGRTPSCSLSQVKLLPNADVLLSTEDGRPLRGSRTLADGTLPTRGLVGVKPGEAILATARAGDKVIAKRLIPGRWVG